MIYVVWVVVCGLCLDFVVSGVLWFVAFGLIGLCFVVRLVSGGFWLCGLGLLF